MRKSKKVTGWRKALEVFNTGLMTLLKPLQVVSNFVFLTLAYVFGVGLSALFYRLGSGRAKSSATTTSSDGSVSYWRELPPAPRDKDVWLRPF